MEIQPTKYNADTSVKSIAVCNVSVVVRRDWPLIRLICATQIWDILGLEFSLDACFPNYEDSISLGWKRKYARNVYG